jgi:hypothetical protein
MVDLTNYFKALLAPRKLGMAAAETGATVATDRNQMSPLARAALGAAQFAPGPMAIGSLAAPLLQHFSGQGNDMHRGGLRPPMQGPTMPAPQEQGPPMSLAGLPTGTINPHPVMSQPIAAPGPPGQTAPPAGMPQAASPASAPPGMPFNPYAGMPPQSNPTAPAVGDPRMTTGGPDLINKMLAYFHNKQNPS